MRERWKIVLLLGVAALVYGNTLWNSFTYDDFPYVLNNPAVTNPSLTGVFAPTRASNVFRPVLFATLALNWKLGSIHPGGYHLLNLLLHSAVTLLLYLVLKKLLIAVAYRDTAAFAAALLFAVHPIHTEAVASVFARSELLAAAFLLAAWLLHLHDKTVPSLVCFALALFSKESAIAFIPLAVAGDYLLGKLKTVARYLWIVSAGGAYVLVLWVAQGRRFGEVSIHFVDNPLVNLPAVWRILNALRIAWKYVGLQIYPPGLSSDYSYNAIPTYTEWRYLLLPAIGAVAAVALWIWALWKRQTGWALAGAIYLSGFLTTANILIPTGTIMAERLAYLPSAGFCLLIVLLWIELWNHRPAFAWAVLGLLLAVLGLRTIQRNYDWRTNFTLFKATVRDAPDSARAHTNLGGQYMEQGKLDIALGEYRVALSIYPDYPDALEFSGLIESRQGHDGEALVFLQHALSVTHKDSTRYVERAVSLAAAFDKLGLPDNAMAVLDEALTTAPRDSQAWSNRAALHYKLGETANARNDAEKALTLDPLNAQAASIVNAISAHVNPSSSR